MQASKLLEYCARPPRKQEPSWRNLASKLKHGASFDDASKDHIEKIKPQFDVSDSLAKLEEELQEEMAVALGKTGDKCVYYFKLLDRAHEEYLMKKDEKHCSLEERVVAAQTFNVIRQEADAARRNLIIHRQAIGFYWNNHKIIENQFPLPPKLKEPTV